MKSEIELIKSAQSGDREAYKELVEQNGDKVYSLCFKLTGNTHDTADLWQEAFLSGYRNIRKFKYKCSFSNWMYRITVNIWKNKLVYDKRHGFGKNVSLDEPIDTEKGEIPRSIQDTSLNPEVSFEINQRNETILKALEELDPRLRTVIVLCVLEDKTYKETSEITECSLRSVKSKLSRARELLRNKLTAQLEGI